MNFRLRRELAETRLVRVLDCGAHRICTVLPVRRRPPVNGCLHEPDVRHERQALEGQ